MISLSVDITDNFQAALKAANVASFKNVSHAAASIRKAEIASFQVAAGPSQPGTPPHTHPGIVRSGKRKGQQRLGQFPKAIAFYVDKEKGEAVIGPRGSIAGTSASAHEFGGEYKGEEYPARPFAGPALKANVDRFAASWAGSIGG
jgi:hypothetical protein